MISFAVSFTGKAMNSSGIGRRCLRPHPGDLTHSLPDSHRCSASSIPSPILYPCMPVWTHVIPTGTWEGRAGLRARRASRPYNKAYSKNAVWLCNWLSACARFLTLRKPEFENLTLSMFKNNHWNRCANVPSFLSWGLRQHCYMEHRSRDQNAFSSHNSKNIFFSILFFSILFFSNSYA